MKKWEDATCDICASKRFRVFLHNLTTWEHEGVFGLVKCTFCGLVYLYPRPTKNKIGKYYPKESYWGDNKLKVRETQFRFLYEIILREKKRGTILDIGAGTGVFLTKFQEIGWEVYGVELAQEAVSAAKKEYGLTFKSGDFLDFQFSKNYFDVVTLNNVLEHLYKPRKTLVGIHSILKDDGILLITVPNIESLGFKLFGGNWYPLQPPRHLYHFSPKTLADILDRLGFAVVSVNHDYHVHNEYSLFESFRFLFSPRFKKRRGGGLVHRAAEKQKFSAVTQAGKIAGRIFAFTIARIGSLLGHGDVITVYAKKKS